jgi:DNA-binding XRE family transcriptional regulator
MDAVADPKPGQSHRQALATWTERNPIRAWRTQYGYTLADVGRELNVNLHTVAAWEWGTAMPNDDNMAAIARMLGLVCSDIGPTWRTWYDDRPRIGDS